MKITFKSVIKFLIVSVGLIVLVVANLLFHYLIIPSVLFMIMLGAYYFMKYKEKKDKAEQSVPQEELDDLKYAERRIIEEHGEINPTAVLWEIYKRRQNRLGAKEPGNGSTYTGTRVPAIPQQYGRRQDFQDNIIAGVEGRLPGDDSLSGESYRRPKANNRKGLFGRKRI